MLKSFWSYMFRVATKVDMSKLMAFAVDPLFHTQNGTDHSNPEIHRKHSIMNWIKFTIWILGIYTCYYAVLILWDLFRAKRSESSNDKPELTFITDEEPVRVVGEEPSFSGVGSAVISSGGVSLKDLFNLARDESVEYIKAVSF